MSHISVARATSNVWDGTTALIKRDVYEAIYNFDPYQTPITQFYMANKSAKYATGNPKFELIEDVLVSHTFSLTTITGNNTITASEDAIKQLKLGTLVLVPSTGEICRVTTAAATSTTATVARADSGSALTNVATAETALILPPAFAEGSAAATPVSTVATFPYNYTQIIKQAVGQTGTQAATVNYGGSDWTNQRVKATKEWKLALERMFVYGHRYLVTTAYAETSGRPSAGNIWHSGGLLDSSGAGITTSSQFVGTSVFADETYFFNTYCKNLFAKGSNSKVLYLGADALLAINDYQKVKQQTSPMEKEYGVDIRNIITPFGRLSLVWHPVLEQGQYSYYGIGVDRDDYMKYAYLSGNGINRDMQYQTNVHNPGDDIRVDQYLAQVGMSLAGAGQGIHRVIYPGATS